MRIIILLIAMFPVVLSAREREKGTVTWDNRLTVNSSLSGGNTESNRIGGDFRINRNELWINEYTLTGSGDYQRENGAVIAQNCEVAFRYGWSITEQLYNFYRMAWKHNRILEISSQYIPSCGLGYWFYDDLHFRLLLEAGAGYNRIYYQDERVKSEFIFQSRFFAEFRIDDRFSMGNNTYCYYGVFTQMIDSNTYLRIHADSHLALKSAFIVSYNNRPGYDLEKMDYQLRTGIELKIP